MGTVYEEDENVRDVVGRFVETLLVLLCAGPLNGAKGLCSYPHVLVAVPWL